MLTSKPSTEPIKQAAMKNGMASLRQNAWACVLKGATTVEETLYVTSKDNL